MKTSTTVKNFNYNPQNQELEVTFQSGERYRYASVPQSVATEFDAASSPGAFVNRTLRSYKSSKIS